MPSVVLVGAQWGDEGKGKISDILSSCAKHIVRSQGGNNAGHTVVVGEDEYKLHLVPVGILHAHTQCYIGPGTVIDPNVLIQEISNLEKCKINLSDRLWISPNAHLILPYHRLLDAFLEKRKGRFSVGTTGRGIGPCYADKANRLGIRMIDLVQPETLHDLLKMILEIKNSELANVFQETPLSFDEIYKECLHLGKTLERYIAHVEQMVNAAIDNRENILFEGAQGTFLDSTIGTYPFVTSSSTIAAGICAGAGIGPRRIDHALGVIKAFATRVGHGPFPTELNTEETFPSHEQAREFGTTTGRRRRMGWFDAVLAKTAVKMNGLDSLALTKLDVLDELDSIKICTEYLVDGKRCQSFPAMENKLEGVSPIYEILPGWKKQTTSIHSREDLPLNAQRYLCRIEELCGTPISILSYGPKREQTCLFKEIYKGMENPR